MSRANRRPVDPADQAVIAQGLIAGAKEMGAKLIRSAYSPIVREASDCAAALLDRHGNVVAQAELIPMQLGSIGATFKPCAKLFPPVTLEEGDLILTGAPPRVRDRVFLTPGDTYRCEIEELGMLETRFK